jgi:TolA-binding protein
VHYNASRNDDALGKFRSVVRQFPASQEAVQAVNTAKLIYVEEGRVREYADWVKDLDFVEVTDAELDNTSYDSANRQLLDGKKDQAIKSFQDYLNDFPNGLHRTEAHFELAQLLFEKGDKQGAIPHYEAVVQSGTGASFEQALTRICEIYVSLDDYASAMPYLEDLENVADIDQNRTFARSNLMKGYYRQENYEKTLEYAEMVEATPGIDNRIRSDARIMIARTAIALGDEDRAKTAYAEVERIASGAIAAEAYYYRAYFEHKEGRFEVSNTTVQKLASDYSGYKEWGGKGLILMAKNYYELDDAFQATYILESVTKNFAEFPELVSEATMELDVIKAKEAQRNSSVPTDSNE